MATNKYASLSMTALLNKMENLTNEDNLDMFMEALGKTGVKTTKEELIAKNNLTLSEPASAEKPAAKAKAEKPAKVAKEKVVKEKKVKEPKAPREPRVREKPVVIKEGKLSGYSIGDRVSFEVNGKNPALAGTTVSGVIKHFYTFTDPAKNFVNVLLDGYEKSTYATKQFGKISKIK